MVDSADSRQMRRLSVIGRMGILRLCRRDRKTRIVFGEVG